MQAKKSKMPITGNRTKSSRAGLVFPVGRIRRHLKSVNASLRIGSASAVYMAAILEYLTAELL
jgi:histone H2A